MLVSPSKLHHLSFLLLRSYQVIGLNLTLSLNKIKIKMISSLTDCSGSCYLISWSVSSMIKVSIWNFLGKFAWLPFNLKEWSSCYLVSWLDWLVVLLNLRNDSTITTHLISCRCIHGFLTAHWPVDSKLYLDVLVSFQGIELLKLFLKASLHSDCFVNSTRVCSFLRLRYRSPITYHADKRHIVAYSINDL